jgi:non-heme chloroperoxidase
MSTVVTEDGTHIFYKDWGAGKPVVFSHGWPLASDAWDNQMMFLGSRGYRVIAHDRRGHTGGGEVARYIGTCSIRSAPMCSPIALSSSRI